MRLSRTLAALAVVPALVLPASAFAAGGAPSATDLTGAEEVPGPGDADATGVASLSLNQGQGRVCFDLAWADIDGTVVAAHIHLAPAGVAGPVVVGLLGATALDGTDSASGCVEGVEPGLVKAIRKEPENYYVNVHSTVFPAGAIRGQLG